MIARHLAACAVASLLALSACAQASLESLVSDAKAGWMFANWQAETENGDKVTLNVSWDLEKHLAVLHVKIGDMESKSLFENAQKISLTITCTLYRNWLHTCGAIYL